MAGWRTTSVANGALLVSSSPIVITLLSTVMGKERLGALHWAGTLLSFLGIYIVVGRGAHVSDASLRGDLMLLGAVVCWALYTIGARPLMARHSPVGVTALSMLLGTLMYLPLAAAASGGGLGRGERAHVDQAGLLGAVRALRRLHDLVRGGARDRQRPDLGLFQPAADRGHGHRLCWLGEPLGLDKLAGAAAVLAGVALTRLKAHGYGSGRLRQP